MKDEQPDGISPGPLNREPRNTAEEANAEPNNDQAGERVTARYRTLVDQERETVGS